MIQFREREIKNLVLEPFPKLRTVESKFKNVSVCYDRTKNEREQYKKLFEEAEKSDLMISR